ncbi:uncharacterized protein LOC115382270 isoform X2 [Salarias fasciatus]|uniref:uncharacterized protein LOC115382270 isoform X2 n=1 Tax=Salarias fasciatus TaxID=181472 RepID=UPI001176500D|nr:uncharacterized protein LOC115382270 isoform X2 [Salarias fasciatus]XP_029939833.1 uncharacterized protein LOC115382270 isoform X2 [Salarias fasciatus]
MMFTESWLCDGVPLTRCALWVQRLCNPSLKGISSEKLHQSYRVCSVHFDTTQFKRPSDVHAGLKWNAVPKDQSAPITATVVDISTKSTQKDAEEKKLPCPAVFSCKLIKEEPPSPVIVSIQTIKEEKELPSPVVFSNMPLKEEEEDKPLYPVIFNIKSIKEEEDTMPSSQKNELSDGVDSSSHDGVTDHAVQHPDDSKADITGDAFVFGTSDVSAARPSVSQTPLLTPKHETKDSEVDPMVRTLEKKCSNLTLEVVRLKAKVRELRWSNELNRAGVQMVPVIPRLKKLLPGKTYAFVRTQIRVSRCHPDGFPWSNQEKALFLSMFHDNPVFYRRLLHVFSMPSVKTLKRIMKSRR